MGRLYFFGDLILVAAAISALALTAYFGFPNPVPVGLGSSVAVAAIVLAVLVFARSLSIRIASVVGFLLLSFCFFITVANWWHYQYFQVFFNYEFLPFARDSGDVLKALPAFSYKKEAAYTGITYLFLFVFYAGWFKWRELSPFRARIGAISLLLAGLGLLYWVDSVIADLRKANAFTLSPYYLHPVHAFMIPLDSKSADTLSDWSYFKKRNRVLAEQEYFPVGLDSKPYNILVITMESFRASFLGAYGQRKGLTPNFDRISQRGFLFRNFYANTNYTVKGENAIICGIFDHNAKISIAEYPGEKNLECMASALKAKGYETLYMHANYGRFYNRKYFMPQQGFRHLYFHADKPGVNRASDDNIGWGLADAEFFKLALDKVSQMEVPFYAHLLSISNHYPFDYDWPVDVPNSLEGVRDEERVYLAYENAIFYSDYALGVFWKEFESSQLFENTIVVITADHGVWSFAANEGLDETYKDEEFFRMPLFIYHPEFEGYREVDQVSSQVDLPVTLMNLVGAEFDAERFLGKDLFDRVEAPWAVLMKGGQISFREAGRLCLPVNTDCAGAYQSCWAGTSAADVSDFFGMSQCYEIDGDLLRGGKVMPVEGQNKFIDKAFGMVAYENRRVFENAEDSELVAPVHLSLRQLFKEVEKD
ncbi:LTA synthase family protein [Microbulbifer sp. 2201CG32-9]|uniref:LTA synthase family protein n=1 Tax=Microbulbifer sp. 2201CG32-9 TaxID=3232309 RepID=UPI00345B6F46